LVKEILPLYRKFEKYDCMSDSDLGDFLLPSLYLDQFAKHYYHNELVGFTNWALLSNEAHDFCFRNGVIDPRDWNSGPHVWHMETIATGFLKDIMTWTKRNLATKFGVGEVINWLRNDNDLNIIRRSKIKTKESWL